MQSEQHDSWRSRGKHKGRERFIRDARRIVIVVTVSALAFGFVGFLVKPFLNPQTHLVLMGTGKSLTLSVPSIGFVDRDHDLFRELESGRIVDCRDRFKSAKSAANLADDLLATGAAAEDTLVVYLAAHGVSQDGTAYVLCDDFDLRRPELGRLPLETVLKQIRKSPAKTKLLLVNHGPIEYDPRMGMVVNEFPRLLARAVRETNDPSLWVLCSHDLLQTSNVSLAAKHSVFGMFAAHGLCGAADLNGDHEVSVIELAKFASANVSTWVRQNTGGSVDQTPRLIWGGGKLTAAADPVAVSIRDRTPHVVSVDDLIEDEQESGADREVIQLSEQTRGVLHRHQVTLASSKSGANASAVTQSGKKPVQAGSESLSDTQDTEAIGDKEDAPNASVNENVKVLQYARQLLHSAWLARDQASNRWSESLPIADPIENVPHLYREFENELLSYDNRLRLGDLDDAQEIVSILKPSFGEKQSSESTVGADLLRISNRDQRRARYSQLKAHSIALTILFAEFGGPKLPFDIQQITEALNSPTRKELDAWFSKNWKNDFQDYCELALLKSILDRQDFDWEDVQLIARSCFESERVAAMDFWAPGWIREQVGLGDQQRLYAQQLLVEKSGTDWRSRARRLMAGAIESYSKAEAIFATVRDAQRTRDAALKALPNYLRCHRVSPHLAIALDITTDDLEKLIDNLAELSETLANPNRENHPKINQLKADIQSIQARIEQATSDQAIAAVLAQPVAAARTHWLKSVLSMPLISASSRAKINEFTQAMDRELARDYVLADLQSIAAAPLDPISDGAVGQFRQHLADQSRLITKSVELVNVAGRRRDGVQFVRDRMNDFTSHSKSPSQGARQETTDTLNSSASRSFWDAQAAFGNAVGEYLSSLAIPSPSDATGIRETSLAAAQTLRVLDPRDAWKFRSVDVSTLRNEARLQSTLSWQASRAEQSEVFVGAALGKAYAAAVESFRQQSMIMNASDASPARVTVSIVGPDRLDLQYAREQRLSLRIVNPSEQSRTVVVSCDYDEQMFRIASASAGGHSDADQSEFVFQSGRSPYRTKVSRPISVPAGGEFRWTMKVVRREHATSSSKVTFDAFDVTGIDHRELIQDSFRLAPNQLLARKSISMLLPVAELIVERGNRSLTSDENGLRLTPYPNRMNSFRLGFFNQSPDQRRLSVQAFAVDSQTTIDSSSDLDDLINDQPPLMTMDLDPIAAMGATYWKPNPAETAKVAKDPAKTTEKADESSGRQKFVRNLEALLFVLRDLDSGQVTLRKLSFAVQRPRRFVRPKVGFNAGRGRIEVEVSANRADLLPDGAPVVVNCHLRGAKAAQTRGKLQDVLSPNKLTASLFIDIPPGSFQTEELLIDIDGYPRAFRFDVPCGKHSSDLPEIYDRVDVHVKAGSGDRFLSAVDELPLTVAVDAPAGTFENDSDSIEIGLDLDQTGLPEEETLIRLNSDRSVQVGFFGTNAAGEIQVLPQVSDHSPRLSVERLENVPLNVAGRLTVQNVHRTIPSIPFYIDTAAPLLGSVQREPTGEVSVGTTLKLSTIAWDNGSGVRVVEAVLVPRGVSGFPEKAAIIRGTNSQGRSWVLDVPAGTAPGPQTLLVRGVDAVGNASDPVAIDIDVLAPKKANASSSSVEVSGFVSYRGEKISQAVVELETLSGIAKETKPGRKTVSTSDGQYRLSAIAPGNYKITAKAVIRNRVRLAERKLEVKPGLEPKLKIDVLLR